MTSPTPIVSSPTIVFIGYYPNAVVDKWGHRFCPLCSPNKETQIPKDTSWMRHALSASHLTQVALNPNPLTKRMFVCIPCNQICSGEESVALHVEGPRHQRKIAPPSATPPEATQSPSRIARVMSAWNTFVATFAELTPAEQRRVEQMWPNTLSELQTVSLELIEASRTSVTTQTDPIPD